VHDWMNDRRADRECSPQHGVRIRGDDMERAGSRSARGGTFVSAGEQYATAVRPVQLAVVD
ncbi:MAG: hypothetical protein ACRD1G_07750, partial [Acidimicrobiales bacterium]